VCGGDLLCFEVVARDPDFNPAIGLSDTTFLSWNAALAPLGATFLPKYTVANRRKPAPLGGPRQDSFDFCWQPTPAMASNTPYYFTVKARDLKCPTPGTTTRAFAIKVLEVADIAVIKTDYKCGNWKVGIQKKKPAQQFLGTKISISRYPYDYSMVSTYDYIGQMSSPVIRFTTGGKYLIRINADMPGPYGVGVCPRTLFDTLYVDTVVTPFVRDTFTCTGSPVTLPATAKWGKAPYFYYWYVSPDTSITALPLVPGGTANPQVPSRTFAPTHDTRYTLKIVDINGCRNYDSNIMVLVKPLPVFSPPDSQRICFGTSHEINMGNNNGNLWYNTPTKKSFTWKVLATGVTVDTLQTITRSDSNAFTLEIRDSFGCVNTDTFMLYVNPQIIPNAGPDTVICDGDTATLTASGGLLYEWRDITKPAEPKIISAKSHNPAVRVWPNNPYSHLQNIMMTYVYEVRVFSSYPDTTKSYLECSKTDTLMVTIRPLAKITRPNPLTTCHATEFNNMPPVVTNQPGGIGVWSYPAAPGAVEVAGAFTKVYTDSLRNQPTDSLMPQYTDNWVRYKYTSPISFGGCVSYDSSIVRVYADPAPNAGPRMTFCVNGPSFPIVYSPTFKFSPLAGSPPEVGGGGTEVWSGLGVVATGPGTYRFDPSKANTLPGRNIINYKYTYKYNPGPSCQGEDTTIFEVQGVPEVDAGTLPPVCITAPQFNMTNEAHATTTPDMGYSFWETPELGLKQSQAMKDSQTYNASLSPIPAGTLRKSWKVYYRNIVFNSNILNALKGCEVKDSAQITVSRPPQVDLVYDGSTAEIQNGIPVVCFKTDKHPFRLTVDSAGGAVSLVNSEPAFSVDPTPTNGGLRYNGWFNSDVAVAPVPPLPFPPENPDPKFKHLHEMIVRYKLHIGINPHTSDSVACYASDTAYMAVQMPPDLAIDPPGPNCADSATFFLKLGTIPIAPYQAYWTKDPTASGYFFGTSPDSSNTRYHASAADISVGGLNVYASTVKRGPCPIKSDSAHLKINPMPKADFDCYDCEGCMPVDARLAARNTNSTGSSFSWINDHTGQAISADSSVTAHFPDWGRFPIRLKVTTGEGCTALSPPKDVVVHAFPKVDFDPDPPVTTIAKPFFDFVNKSVTPDGSAMNFLWQLGAVPGTFPPEPRYSTEHSPRDVPFDADTSTQTGKTIWLKVTTEFGCVDSLSKDIKINPDITVFVPSAFYPGSVQPCPNTEMDPDCNKVFKVAADGYMTIEIYVFNRWGQQLFFTNDAKKGWDGTFNGAQSPQDVYIYQINATSYNGKKYTYSGSVTLLR
jgi:gliding motility-associated-like protein